MKKRWFSCIRTTETRLRRLTKPLQRIQDLLWHTVYGRTAEAPWQMVNFQNICVNPWPTQKLLQTVGMTAKEGMLQPSAPGLTATSKNQSTFLSQF